MDQGPGSESSGAAVAEPTTAPPVAMAHAEQPAATESAHNEQPSADSAHTPTTEAPKNPHAEQPTPAATERAQQATQRAAERAQAVEHRAAAIREAHVKTLMSELGLPASGQYPSELAAFRAAMEQRVRNSFDRRSSDFCATMPERIRLLGRIAVASTHILTEHKNRVKYGDDILTGARKAIATPWGKLVAGAAGILGSIAVPLALAAPALATASMRLAVEGVRQLTQDEGRARDTLNDAHRGYAQRIQAKLDRMVIFNDRDPAQINQFIKDVVDGIYIRELHALFSAENSFDDVVQARITWQKSVPSKVGFGALVLGTAAGTTAGGSLGQPVAAGINSLYAANGWGTPGLVAGSTAIKLGLLAGNVVAGGLGYLAADQMIKSESKHAKLSSTGVDLNHEYDGRPRLSMSPPPIHTATSSPPRTHAAQTVWSSSTEPAAPGPTTAVVPAAAGIVPPNPIVQPPTEGERIQLNEKQLWLDKLAEIQRIIGTNDTDAILTRATSMNRTRLFAAIKPFDQGELVWAERFDEYLTTMADIVLQGCRETDELANHTAYPLTTREVADDRTMIEQAEILIKQFDDHIAANPTTAAATEFAAFVQHVNSVLQAYRTVFEAAYPLNTELTTHETTTTAALEAAEKAAEEARWLAIETKVRGLNQGEQRTLGWPDTVWTGAVPIYNRLTPTEWESRFEPQLALMVWIQNTLPGNTTWLTNHVDYPPEVTAENREGWLSALESYLPIYEERIRLFAELMDTTHNGAAALDPFRQLTATLQPVITKYTSALIDFRQKIDLKYPPAATSEAGANEYQRKLSTEFEQELKALLLAKNTQSPDELTEAIRQLLIEKLRLIPHNLDANIRPFVKTVTAAQNPRLIAFEKNGQPHELLGVNAVDSMVDAAGNKIRIPKALSDLVQENIKLSVREKTNKLVDPTIAEEALTLTLGLTDPKLIAQTVASRLTSSDLWKTGKSSVSIARWLLTQPIAAAIDVVVPTSIASYETRTERRLLVRLALKKFTAALENLGRGAPGNLSDDERQDLIATADTLDRALRKQQNEDPDAREKQLLGVFANAAGTSLNSNKLISTVHNATVRWSIEPGTV